MGGSYTRGVGGGGGGTAVEVTGDGEGVVAAEEVERFEGSGRAHAPRRIRGKRKKP
jgi:hypothetical protein